MLSVSPRLALAAACVLPALHAAPTARADDPTFNGALAGQAGDGSSIFDTTVRSLVATELPDCTKKLLVLTQCYGGDFLDDFAANARVAVASATFEGEKSHYNTYDIGAAFGLRPGQSPPRSALDMHTDAVAFAQQAAADAGIVLTESPSTGGGLSLGDFPLDMFGPSQAEMHILFYAGQPEPPDLDALMIIMEFYPYADIVVVSSGILQPFVDYPATYDGFAAAMDAIGNRMGSCDHQFVLFASDHGQEIWNAGQEDEIFLNLEIPTPPLPPSVEDDLNGTPSPAPSLVIFVPFPPNTPPFAPPPAGPPPFQVAGWSVSVPLPGGGAYASGAARAVYIGGADGLVGDAAGDGVRLEFDMTAADFIDAFVGHPNVVTVTNATGQPWTISLQLDPGPIRKVDLPPPPPFCPADFNGDGFLDFFDADSFTACFEGTECPDGRDADFNADGFVDFFDIDSFIEAFEAGC